MKNMKLFVLACIMSFATAASGCALLSPSSSSSKEESLTSSVEETSTPDSEESSVEEKEVSITLYVDNDDLTVAVAGSKQMRVDVENANKDDVVYEVISGPATIGETGLLTVSETAEVGAKIQVVAKIGDDSSNALEFTVVDAVATTIALTPSAETISKGEEVTFTATFTPDYATTTEYTLSIEGKASDFAQIVDGVLTIKADAQSAKINGQEIRVKATLNANNTVFNYAFIEVQEKAAVTYLSCETLNVVVNRDSNKSIITEAYSWDGEEMTVAADELTYEVENENVATVDETGKVTAKGHGSTVVTVKYGENVSAECVVNVMVAPENIKFEKLNAHMANVGEVYYGMGEGNYFDLGVVSETKTGYVSSTQNVTYRFEDIDSGETADLATVTEEGISFAQTGKIRVTVLSNSSVDDYEVSEQYEVKKSIIVNVNEGMNLYTIDDLKEYAKSENAGKTANVMNDLYVDDTHNFGNETNLYIGLTIYGSRTIQGNGCMISAENLSRGKSEDTNKYAFIQFHHGEGVNAPFSVALYDLTLLGNVNIKGEHIDGTDITSSNSKDLKNNYYRALEFSGAELATYDAGNTSAVLESVIVKNVTVKGFYTAMRYEHALSALVEDVLIGDCFANGIENVQSHMIVKDVEIGQVGAFGIEVSSDDMRGADTATPAGTAGRQYDETATIRYEGEFKCNNLNNGASTVYMQKLSAELGASVAELAQAATIGLIQKLSGGNTDIQNGLLGVCGQTMMNMSTGEFNFSTLVFVNPFDFQQYATLGNTEEKFCEFSTTEKINVKTMFENLIANPNYNYKEKKYLILDLADLDIGLGVPVNLGQIILMNLAYGA